MILRMKEGVLDHLRQLVLRFLIRGRFFLLIPTQENTVKHSKTQYKTRSSHAKFPDVASCARIKSELGASSPPTAQRAARRLTIAHEPGTTVL